MLRCSWYQKFDSLIIKKSKFWCQKEDIVLGKISLTHIPHHPPSTERKLRGTYAREIRDLRVVLDDIVALKVSLYLTTSQGIVVKSRPYSTYAKRLSVALQEKLNYPYW